MRIFHGPADVIAAFGNFNHQCLSCLPDGLGDFARFAIQRLADFLSSTVDLTIDAVIGSNKAFDQLMAAQGDLLDHLLATIGQGAGDIFGALAQKH